MIKNFLFSFLLLFSSSAFSFQTCTFSSAYGTSDGSHTSCSSAASSVLSSVSLISFSIGNCPTPTPTVDNPTINSVCNFSITINSSSGIPTTSSGSGATIITYVAQPETCTPGTTKTVNYTLGWAASTFNGMSSADIMEIPNGVPSADMNDGICKGILTGVTGCFVSTEPAQNGMFRVSCDYTMQITGPSGGDPADSAADPNTPPPNCPGGQGEVNGKSVCLPEPNTPMQPYPDVSPTPTTPDAGNPRAGEKPTTGPGSGVDGPGRTPDTGDGGNGGGPATASECDTPSQKYASGTCVVTPKPPETQKSLCEQFPDILACKKLEAPTDGVIPKQNRDITFQSGPTFSGASCPPDVVVNISGRSITVLKTSQACGWIQSFMRPIILLLASISAAFIVLPRAE